ncbi:low specificity L-threonine aldolase [Escherichia coli]|uniref:Low specificity L-threonine aldolase n=1 Tax=Escherichia coli TaxID=562 RepID=A0A376TI86_ECOLX|nr:low specificity L-threonine aldolase [Escherichia coli]
MIDLRSDTVTRPSRAMLEAMMAAPGWGRRLRRRPYR